MPKYLAQILLEPPIKKSPTGFAGDLKDIAKEVSLTLPGVERKEVRSEIVLTTVEETEIFIKKIKEKLMSTDVEKYQRCEIILMPLFIQVA